LLLAYGLLGKTCLCVAIAIVMVMINRGSKNKTKMQQWESLKFVKELILLEWIGFGSTQIYYKLDYREDS
jgi:hypothetical protein